MISRSCVLCISKVPKEVDGDGCEKEAEEMIRRRAVWGFEGEGVDGDV